MKLDQIPLKTTQKSTPPRTQINEISPKKREKKGNL